MTGWERPYLDQLLGMIQDEEGYIKLLDGDRFRLTQEGVNHCKRIYPTMS
jgi:hypothetical protein